MINFAAETHVDNSIINPDNFIKTNINGVFNLLKISNKFWMKKPHMKKNFINTLDFIKFPQMRFMGQLKLEILMKKVNLDQTRHIRLLKLLVICLFVASTKHMD